MLVLDPSRCWNKLNPLLKKAELPKELSRVHNTFHVSNLKKYYADEPLERSVDNFTLNGKLCSTPCGIPLRCMIFGGVTLDVPPRPLNPQPLQSLPSLDITLSLSLITPLENLSSPPSPSPPPPPPQPPIMGHPLYYNYPDYHGSTCICCFHNRNLHLNLRDEMNIMFAHLEYLLTTTFTTYFPPPP
ncbi:hypothetical protein Tco_1336464 [Tanacetum coccineum]